MTSILGPYWSPWHRYPQDEDYIRRLDPAWVLIHQPQARDVSMAQRLAPGARIMLRSWDIDDSNGERKQEMYTDPVGAARKHLGMWKGKWNQLVDELHKNNWPFDESRWYIQLVNEPDPAYVQQMVDYSLEAMRLVQGTQIRLGLVVSSVGTFSKPSENSNGWTLCKPLEGPINAGGHILVVHEYWQPEGPNYGEDGGNLAWRHHSIPLNVPILIGESGANGYIYQRYSQNDDAGWQKTVKDPNVYAAQVKEYIEGCDTRVQGVLLFMLDYHSEQWWSFYTGPAAEQLLAIKDARPQVASPFSKPIDTHLPAVSTGPLEPPIHSGIIDPRVAQAILNVESGGHAFGADGKPLIRFEAHIFKNYLPHDQPIWNAYFRTDPDKPWLNQEWRTSLQGEWKPIHTGDQADEYAAFNFARGLNALGAYNSISMGTAQIMGFNANRVGFATAQSMYEAFKSAPMQTFGFINYFLSDPALLQAVHDKDWREIAKRYNGTGAVDSYSALLRDAYDALGAA